MKNSANQRMKRLYETPELMKIGTFRRTTGLLPRKENGRVIPGRK